ncbi:MAG: hypothetical protein JSV17_17700 [Candidatus Aminicenantes bacterium]|nr:MAG: hypothetical protein JSV17_17700 [Candidatus Aminicenantes bacterium]
MSTKRNKIIMGLLLGLLLVNWTLGMTLFIPPEIFIWDQALQNTSAEHDQVRVIKQNAVLRIKPKNGAVIIKKLPLGALLEVEEEIGDWLKITLPPDEDGFVLTGYLLQSFTEKGSIIHE